MITAWQVASIPFWISGYAFCFVGAKVATMTLTDPARRKDQLAETGICIAFGLPFLIISAWMWH